MHANIAGLATRPAGLVLILLLLLAPASASETDVVVVSKPGTYQDVRGELEDAIVAAGLKIDFNGHVGRMLERTGPDVGSTKPIYSNAEYFTFCSAALSRTAMEADPANLHVCPYAAFVYERADRPGTIHVGYRRPALTGSAASKAALAEIDKLLDRIVRAAAK